MDLKTICVLFVAIAIVSVEANTANVNTAATSPDLPTSDTTGTATQYLRSKRQFFGGGYPGGYGGSSATSFANAGAFGGGGYGNAGAFSSANAAAIGLGKK